MWLRLVVVAIAFSAGLLEVKAQCEDFHFASYYASYMTLQRAPASAVVWGYAVNDGDLVEVTFDGGLESTTAYIGPEGVPMWEVTLPSRDAGGPYEITATSAGCEISMTEVLFGDVYICSGQSNMEFRMDEVDDPDDDIADTVNYPDIRTFQVSNIYSEVPLYDLAGIDRTWALPNADNMASFSAVCWYYARTTYIQTGVPLGLIQSDWWGSRIEAWSSPEALYECFGEDGPPADSDHNQEQVLWNGMIHPFLPMPIFGALWYQGEQNSGRHDDYYCSLPAMINDWRAKWFAASGQTDPMFPFGEVQLAPDRDNDLDTGFTDVRWAQASNVGYCPNDVLQNVFMAVAADLPDFDSPSGSIHPRYKRQIGYRLALGGLNLAYGMGATIGRFQGPFPTTITQQGDQIFIEYDDGLAQLEFRDTAGFELCCSADDVTTCPGTGADWVHSDIITQGTSDLSLNINCDASDYIMGLRYIWRESPCPLEACAVYSVDNNLPAPPYKYDGPITKIN